MCVCKCVYVGVCMCIFICVCICMYVCMYVCVYVYVCLCMWVSVGETVLCPIDCIYVYDNKYVETFCKPMNRTVCLYSPFIVQSDVRAKCRHPGMYVDFIRHKQYTE